MLLALYDFLRRHRWVCWLLLVALVAVMGLVSSGLRFEEDIAAFVPLTDDDRAAMERAQQSDNAKRIYVILSAVGVDDLDEPTYAFLDLYDADTLLSPLTVNIPEDYGYFEDVLDKGLNLLPTTLTADDYTQLEATLADTVALRNALIHNKEILQLPVSQYTSALIARDPFGLFASHLQRLNPAAQQSDTLQAVLWLETPYGSTESRNNGVLAAHLRDVAEALTASYPSVSVMVTGAPVIAAANAARIKRDTLICLTVALVLIVLLLLFSLRKVRVGHSLRLLTLLMLTIAFGFLVGLTVLRIVSAQTSMIVLGVGSIIVGIAVNYPLHVLYHRRYTATTRETLQQVLSPLIVGNITTVGAFLALVPLNATALRDLGIFSAAMLLGTICFSVIWLPQMMGNEKQLVEVDDSELQGRSARFSLRRDLVLALVLAVVTLAFGLSARGVMFDTNLSHINYMTPEERAVMSRFDGNATTEGYTQWNAFWQTHAPETLRMLHHLSAEAGFSPSAFEPFEQTVTEPKQAAVPFDYGRIAESLRNNFNYLGTVCSLIVFVFLFLSFSERLRRPLKGLLLALIAFLPMAVSWLWILGIMHAFGLQFNIVNIILATFIFGQGDDYTIFMVEGLEYEQQTGRPLLPQYKRSILLSAFIMFAGIGVLVLAKHPAMFSLGAVTLIGMGCVVLLAYTLPPLVYRLCLRIPFLRRVLIA